MKIAQLLVIVSIISNFTFGMIWIRRSIAQANPPTPTVSPVTAPPAAPAVSTPAPIAINGRDWEKLQTGGDAQLVARLKAGGFPPEIIGIIIAAQLEERFASRRKALDAERRRTPYWRDGYPRLMEADDPQLRQQLRALDREYSDAYRQLTSGDLSLLPDYQRIWKQRQFGTLPPYKIQALEAINRDYDELRLQVQGETQGIIFPEDKARLNLLEQERRADLAQTLSVAELEAYDLRNGEISNGVRHQLSVFNPSEEEFKALYKVQQAYEQRYANANLTPDDSREFREAEVRLVLSPERFAEYQITTAGSYQEVRNEVNRLQLPASTIGDVIRLQRDVVKRANAVRADVSLTPAVRDAQLATLASEAATRLTNSLGTEGFTNYGSRATWFQQLTPRPSSAPKK